VNSAVGSAVMLSGSYELEGEVSRRPLNALPSRLVRARDAWESPLVGLLAAEIVKDDPGQEAVLDRLLDLLLIAVLRVWFARPDADAPGWDRAEGDPVVGKALRLVYDDPAPSLDGRRPGRRGRGLEGGVRALHRTRGRTPDGLATDWRLSLIADLLLQPDATIGSVAYQVGYTTAVRGLSSAFKRLRGVQSQAAQARRSRHLAHPDATAGQRVATTVSCNAVIAVLITPAHQHHPRLVVAGQPGQGRHARSHGLGQPVRAAPDPDGGSRVHADTIPAQRARTASPPRRC
jgi:hypothetical protein